MRQVDVLLIDDNQADIKLTLHVMNEENPSRRVHVIRDGEEAMSFILGHSQDAAAQTPTLGLVLLDLKLPKLNGFEILQALRQQSDFKTLPVVVLSSSNQDRDVHKSYELGANGYVQKPVDFDTFRCVIRRIVAYWLDTNLTPLIASSKEVKPSP
jgi:two-component system, chemotaxis family, response regulator Rcp1